MLPAPVDVAAREQLADDLEGLGEHLVPHVRGRPTPADDVLVEVLPRPQPEGEPAVAASNATVAACWATTAGWYRKVGHVTYVISGTRWVARHRPSTAHAFGAWPCASSQGK